MYAFQAVYAIQYKSLIKQQNIVYKTLNTVLDCPHNLL